MALSDDLRTRVVESVLSGALSRNAAARRFKVSVASAVRWVKQFETTGEISPIYPIQESKFRNFLEVAETSH